MDVLQILDFFSVHPSLKAALPRSYKRKARMRRIQAFPICAEEEGFEPPVPCGTTVFKTAAFDHSAIPPGAKLVKFWDFVQNLS